MLYMVDPLDEICSQSIVDYDARAPEESAPA